MEDATDDLVINLGGSVDTGYWRHVEINIGLRMQ